jgi:hypothetical protein
MAKRTYRGLVIKPGDEVLASPGTYQFKRGTTYVRVDTVTDGGATIKGTCDLTGRKVVGHASTFRHPAMRQ